MRTEEFLRGYDVLRSRLQELIAADKTLQLESLLKLAQYPYYNKEGKDWCCRCYKCPHRILDFDHEMCCELGISEVLDWDGRCEEVESE